MYLIFDTETTGLPKRWDAPVSDSDNWPRCIQIAWQLHDRLGNLVDHQDYLIQPEGFDIPFESEKIHGISTALAQQEGVPLAEALEAFSQALEHTTFLVGQNVGFDLNIVGAEYWRLQGSDPLPGFPVLDTCTEETAELCQIPGGRGGKFKKPTLTELHEHLFGQGFNEAHNATADVEATTRCFLELLRKKHYPLQQLKEEANYYQEFEAVNPAVISPAGLKHQNLKAASAALLKKADLGPTQVSGGTTVDLSEHHFAHLHNHSQFSILQSTMSPKDLVKAASEHKMPAVALTDHSNMMGAFHFVSAVQQENKAIKAANAEGEAEVGFVPQPEITPIVGCEFFVCENHTDRSRKDNGYQVVFLAKNKQGYHNLAKMSSIAHLDGFYYVPRIDREIIKKYKSDLIVLSGNLYGELPSKILNVGLKQAEEALHWWKDEFGDDFYLELMRHGQEEEERVNNQLLQWSREHQIKVVATNNTYYQNQEDAEAHDILLCVKDGTKKETPIGRGRDFRYGLPNQEYYFKSPAQMKELFKECPEAITHVEELIAKITPYELARDVLLPKFDIPQEYVDPLDAEDGGKRGENAYLRYITYEGAKVRYGEVTPEISERIDFELETIANSGYPGYFLIVEDFIREARQMGVSVGPGRGSAAGSVVAYCLTITNIDPIKYDLLFERFLNPDRVSMPDIDIDFDDEGRGRVIDYVVNKYGSNQVAQIITYGTMAGKSSIRDTARVLDLPLSDADRLAKLLPDMTKLNKVMTVERSKLQEKYRSDDIARIEQLQELSKGTDLTGTTLQMAQVLEGSVRNTGIHACGVIITPDDITQFVPVANSKDKESGLCATQFDNSVVESAGLLKMDFLGLKTLTLIKDTVKIVKARTGIELIPDEFPLDDEKTYELFQRGETVGIFQYESRGMQKYLKELKPTVFDDLIAMNALYRPGPMEYIPSFIARKHGHEEITYDLEDMQEYLQSTYGITVYQEQVMLLSQKLAGFSKGEADVLRKAMGKKKFDLIEELRPKFLDGGQKNGHPREVLEKIYKDWEAFASYAFNKSHSTCYAYIAYQTAYLKAHYPAEYMAAVLSNNMNNIETVTFFMEECRRMGLPVLGPDVNESYYKFAVNKDNAIRFGVGAIKGVGKAAVEALVDERKENGLFHSVFDLVKRIDLRAFNKKALESIALAGGLDSFGDAHRAQYFQLDADEVPFLEKIIRFGARFQENENAMQVSLFGGSDEVQIPEPVIPPCEEWGTMEQLKREKEVVGMYLSGHPLDDFNKEIKAFCTAHIGHFKDDLIHSVVNRELIVAGVVTDVQHRVSKNGLGWAVFTVEDYNHSYDFRIFKEEYSKFRHFLVPDCFVYMRVFVKEGWTNRDTGQKGDPRLQFNDFKFLQDVMEHCAKKLTLKLPLERLQEKRIQDLKSTLQKHKGSHTLNIVVYEPQDEIKLNFSSRKQKIDINADLLQLLDQQEVAYKLN